MIRITQTVFGQKEGNCFAACIASLLEIPIEECDTPGTGRDWLNKTQNFLEPLGWFYFEVTIDPKSGDCPFLEVPETYAILSGTSASDPDCLHAVIGRLVADKRRIKYEFVHDPDPGGKFLADITGIGFLVPLRPHRAFKASLPRLMINSPA